jgi:hypothetical protein
MDFQKQEQQKVVITLADLSTVLQLIDVVSTRGGFQGNELAGVGMLRNKIEAFLRQNAPQQAENADVDVAEAPLASKVVE